jgi:hypothetical protein
MTQNSQGNSQSNPPVIGTTHGLNYFLLLISREIVEKYPDKKNPDPQEYCKTYDILEFLIQSS